MFCTILEYIIECFCVERSINMHNYMSNYMIITCLIVANTNLVFGNEQPYSRCFCTILEHIIGSFCVERSMAVSVCIIT